LNKKNIFNYKISFLLANFDFLQRLYLNKEAFRRANIISTPVARMTTEERVILGYRIPANTVVVPLVSLALCDEKV
jgi:cytochrome P450